MAESHVFPLRWFGMDKQGHMMHGFAEVIYTSPTKDSGWQSNDGVLVHRACKWGRF
jgi:hypothetical protein